MKKRLTTLFIALMCFAALPTPSLAYYYGGPSDWACKEIRAALDSGFYSPETDNTNGYPAWLENYIGNNFPKTITRVEFGHIIGTVLAKDRNLITISQCENLYKDGCRSSFTDLYRVKWNYDATLMYYLGIMDGVSKTKFDPFGKVTREQAAIMIAKTVLVLRPELWHEENNYITGKAISDKDKISPWALNCVGFALELGVMSGTEDGKFAPQEFLTTEQALVIGYRLCQRMNVPGTIPVENASHWLDEHRMNRELQFYAGDYQNDPNSGDVHIFYGGFADGIKAIDAWKVTVDGIGELGEPYRYIDYQNAYKAEVHVGARDMVKGQFYTVHVRLTLMMEDGSEQYITDTFVLMY